MSINILVACEESQRVCLEFRKLGFNAFSCDILPTSGVHPEWHIQADVLSVLNDGWDCMIAFPPCTYLTNTGNRWFNVERYGEKARERIAQRIKASEFFMTLYNANIKHIAIENPIGHISTAFRKPDQIIQPYFFGDPERKSTCLWLKGLPTLTKTNIVKPILYKYKDGRTDSNWHMKTINLSPEERSIERSKTFPGIAKAMAEQWGKYLKGCIQCN